MATLTHRDVRLESYEHEAYVARLRYRFAELLSVIAALVLIITVAVAL